MPMAPLLSDRDLAFMLYELLDTESLLARGRYAEHSREVFDATLDAARQLAEKHFAPLGAKGDAAEPAFDGTTLTLIPEIKAAWDAFAGAGFLSAHWDAEEGGLQLPETVLRAAMAYFFAADVGTASYPFLTIGAANLIRRFGDSTQKARWLPAMGDGRSAGTMALTEPGQGSSLADIRTYAVPHADGTYRLYGQKMFISGGDQTLTASIVHMVLARIRGAPPGVKGISLFVVPKLLAGDDAAPGERNDIALAGLLHKMGWRNTTSTVLSFGERGGAVGYLLGEPHQGLAYMFQMMNEARISVGFLAASLAYRGFSLSLEFARERPQGRLPSTKDPLSPQVKLIEHADIRRLLLAQKAIAEGALALCLVASALFEDQHTHPDPTERARSALLLDVLTPVVKSWPAKHGCRANDMAIQVLGGSGYIRDYPLERLYRDQRLNPIHEGAEGIHGLDLLGRKVGIQGGAGYREFRRAGDEAIAAARAHEPLATLADALAAHALLLDESTRVLTGLLPTDPDRALANATIYLDAFGRVAAAWVWLRMATAACRALAAGAAEPDADFYRGKLHAARYYVEWELPVVRSQCELLRGVNPVPLEMRDGWFQ
jgi:butyryl-CoA dehydrogenase